MQSGDDVIIGGGTYNEVPTFNKNGSGPQYNYNIHGDVTNQCGDGTSVSLTGIKLKGSFIRVLNITFVGGSSNTTVLWDGVNTGRMDNCVLVGKHVGLGVIKSKLLLSACTIRDAQKNGIEVEESDELAILNNCEVYGNGDSGVFVKGKASNVVLSRSIVRNNGDHGVEVDSNKSKSSWIV